MPFGRGKVLLCVRMLLCAMVCLFCVQFRAWPLAPESLFNHLSGSLKEELITSHKILMSLPSDLQVAFRRMFGRSGPPGKMSLRGNLLTGRLLDNVHFRNFLPQLEWNELHRLYDFPDLLSHQKGLPANATFPDDVYALIAFHIFLQTERAGGDFMRIFLGHRDYLPADEGTVKALLAHSAASGQEDYEAPKRGLAILTVVGAPFLADPHQPYATPESRLGQQFALAGSTVWEDKIYMSTEHFEFGNFWREFLALYKKDNPSDATWIPPEDLAFRDAQERLHQIADKNVLVVEAEFYFTGMPYQVSGQWHKLNHPQAELYVYGDYAFIRPAVLRTSDGTPVTENMPIFLVEGSLAKAVKPIEGNRYRVRLRHLSDADQLEVKRILLGSHRNRLWFHPLGGGTDMLIKDSEWPFIIASNANYRARKDSVDGYILRELEIFLKNKSKEEIEALVILDIGAGQGTLIRRITTLIKMLHPYVDVSKVTIWGIEPNAILRAAAGANGLHVIDGDIRHLPFPDNCADIAIVQSVLAQNVLSEEDGKLGLNEVHRIVKPMGSTATPPILMSQQPGQKDRADEIPFVYKGIALLLRTVVASGKLFPGDFGHEESTVGTAA